MIESLIDETWVPFQAWTDALGLSENSNKVISIVGAGGKTTILHNLREEWKQRRILHAVTTTTHMKKEDDGSFLEEESLESFFHIYEGKGTVFLGKTCNEEKKQGKVCGADEVFLRELMEKGVSLLIEADGARGLPVKLPGEYEPVVLHETTHVLNVYGMDALGKRICDCAFRSEMLAEFLGKAQDDVLVPENLEKLAASEMAGRKHVPEHAEYHVIFHKCDVLSEAELECMKYMGRKVQECCGAKVHISGR